MRARPARPRPITVADIARLQAHLRATLGDEVRLDRPSMPGGTVQLRIEHDVIGTVDQVDDEGERSWVVTLIVLEEDLSA